MPTGKVLGGTSLVGAIEALVGGARRELFLVSPYFDIDDKRTLQRGIIAATHHASVQLIVRSPDTQTKFKKATVQQLREMETAGVNLLCAPDLHAKIYLSESQLLITSLNLLDSSFGNNIEIGVVFAGDSDEYQQGRRFLVEQVVPFVRQLDVSGDSPVAGDAVRCPASATRAPNTGHCIRCRTSIPLDASKPYCRRDFDSWSEYKNQNYKDKYCHRCSKEHPATLRKPLCPECYAATTR